jgi:hypothetical protein
MRCLPATKIVGAASQIKTSCLSQQNQPIIFPGHFLCDGLVDEKGAHDDEFYGLCPAIKEARRGIHPMPLS